MNDNNLNHDSLWAKRFWYTLGGFLLFRFFLAATLDLTPDEAYYWELSRRLDLSYFDHPPLVAYGIALARNLLGDTALAIRLPALILHPLTTFMVYQMAILFSGSTRTAFLAALFLQVTVAGNALGFITTPDAPLGFCWALAALAFLQAIRTDSWSWWILLGVGLGLGAMAKYNMIFIVPGMVFTLIWFANLRPHFRGSKLWAATALAAMGTLPVLYWNATHDWISFRFQLSHGFRPAEVKAVSSFGEYLGGQLGTIGPLLFPLLFFCSFQALRDGSKQSDPIRFGMAAIALPMMAFFAFNSLRSKVEANWPQVAYLTAMPLVAEWAWREVASRRRVWLIGTSGFLGLLSIVQALTLVIPLNPGMDVSTRLHGWEEFGRLIQEADQKFQHHATFFAQGAPFAALTGFYGKLPPERIAEVNGVGNWKFWWLNRQPPKGSPAIFVDTGRFSEGIAFGQRFYGRILASQTTPIVSRGREIRRIILTPMEDFQGGLSYDMHGLCSSGSANAQKEE